MNGLPKKITLLLAEDHAIVRQGLCSLIRADGRCIVIGEAQTGREAVEMARRLRPDVILMDIAMPELNGLEAMRQILAANPAAKVLVLSAHSCDGYVERINEAGAAGFLEKQSSAEILTEAIHEVAQGRIFFSPAIARRLSRAVQSRDCTGRLRINGNRLSARECEVLQRLAEGLANKQMAAAFGISIKTVEKHRQRLMHKLDIHDTAGLTRYAVAAGIIECNVRLTIG